MTKHTLGPWKARNNSAITAGDMTLARVYWSEGRSEVENIANTSLIAAAPELLESAEAFIECWTAGEFFSNGAVIIAKLRAAVAKAHKCECHESFDCNAGDHPDACPASK